MKRKSYDIVIAGAGPAGIAAALEALRFDRAGSAGRCISGTHVAHSSYRVMRICMAMGQAAGAAAAIMSSEKLSTDTIDPVRIRQHLISRGVKL